MSTCTLYNTQTVLMLCCESATWRYLTISWCEVTAQVHVFLVKIIRIKNEKTYLKERSLLQEDSEKKITFSRRNKSQNLPSLETDLAPLRFKASIFSDTKLHTISTASGERLVHPKFHSSNLKNS